MKILLVEDDDSSIALLTRTLNAQHYIVDAVKDGEMGWTYASTFDYDLIILDIMLPKLDGITLCKRLRGEGSTTPIILLTAQDLITAKLQGLDAGADDYIVKPFDLNELMARMRALLRRSSNNPLPLLSWGDLLLDLSTCDVTYNGQPLILTTKEYDLLELFLRDSYHVFSSDEIIDRLWSSDDFPAEATVRSHLRRLRHKLQVAGAPPDAIATIHGRGYYLKPIQPDLTVRISRSVDEAKIGNEERFLPSAQQQAQYRSFLEETWVTTKPQCLESLDRLSEIVQKLQVGNTTDLEQAHQRAHKLVGTLGIFTLTSGMEIARKIEKILNRSTLLTSTESATLPILIDELSWEIEQFTIANSQFSDTSQTSTSLSSDLPLILFVDLDPSLTDSLSVMAKHQGFQALTLSTIEAANHYLANIPAAPINLVAPTLILVSLSASQATNTTLDFIHNTHQQFPHWSILVLGERDGLGNRLAVVRSGGKFLGTDGLSTEQIFTAVTSLIQPAPTTAKVMVVDDDLDWLRALPQLLQPWGLKVTTLADPQQFWTVLQSVQPDALVLDVKMPEINGLELCQVLRSDPIWQRLPILFLSAANDAIAQQSAFSVGADDYLCKPMMGGEIAWRIRHRLARLSQSCRCYSTATSKI
jgi:DNA-binding response OmpR family regulator/HPt (histidine-containing phosphotransfer) domain-containing protein